MTDLAAYRYEFPVTKRYIYLNHASVSPLPRRSARAIQGHAEDVMLHGGAHYADWVQLYQGVREAAADLLGCSPQEIALTKNTSEGLSVVANGLDWRPGDCLVGIEQEFPANYFPWLQLQRHGVNTRWLRLRQGRVDLDDVDQACRGARLLAISFVQYLSGFRVDLDAVGEICRRHDTLLVVDGVQGLGPFPVDVKRSGVHALAAGAHKWLLGPEGCGILFIDRDLMPQVEPIEFGWTNVEGWRSYSHEPTLRPDACRYECGTLNTVGCYGFRESLKLFLEVGAGQIARHIHRLINQLVVGARAKGYEVMTERDEATGSGIVSLRKQGLDSEATVRRLIENAVYTAHRFGWIRVSPHFYTTDEEIHKLLDLLG